MNIPNVSHYLVLIRCLARTMKTGVLWLLIISITMGVHDHAYRHLAGAGMGGHPWVKGLLLLRMDALRTCTPYL